MKIKRAHGFVEMEYLPCGGTYLHSIVVDPDWRSKGYGSKLLEAALSKARFPVYLFACDELGGDTNRLIAWYRRHGFRKKYGNVSWNYNMIMEGTK